jgi:quinoprotein dehydrogenase-associated probable ABC transporter substrate-binding protein
MFSRCLERGTVFALIGLAAVAIGFGAEPRVLRVAADPNNLPFSNDRGEGFENKLVDLIAHELGATVRYTWWAQRRGFFRSTLKEGDCDIVAGVPRGFDQALTTAPYYRSAYVLVYAKARQFSLHSLDDPELQRLTIGVQMVGDDFSNTPPAHALARRGIVANVRGYTLYGDYRQPNPPARIIDAVATGAIDVAVAWGPLAGYFARQHGKDLVIVPLPERDPVTELPLAFDICVGVRRSEKGLRDELNIILARKRTEIDTLLASYGVPRAEPGP